MSDLDYDGWESDRSGHDDSDHREVSEESEFSPEEGEVIDCAAVDGIILLSGIIPHLSLPPSLPDNDRVGRCHVAAS